MAGAIKSVNAFDHGGDTDRCSGCHLEFDEGEKIMEAMDQDWHTHCFRCYNCAKEFDVDESGDRIYAIHKIKTGVDKPMHPACSQSYLDQEAKKTVTGGWKQTKTHDNHIAKHCMGCQKEIKGQAKDIPWKGKIVQFHLTCFKCGRCGNGMRDNDRFHDDDPSGKPICQKCGGSYKPLDG
eukprot:TRINITY_DN14382_c4_g1_i1.p1 TRINITY_DN14382_c4_g1~~TRINITY_DN14382_c4_g1_i1.p1  ORF type:complete len:180 (+),score=13.96 TRINITY_DN14382_c4_g1_i1:58-597(+)